MSRRTIPSDLKKHSMTVSVPHYIKKHLEMAGKSEVINILINESLPRILDGSISKANEYRKRVIHEELKSAISSNEEFMRNTLTAKQKTAELTAKLRGLRTTATILKNEARDIENIVDSSISQLRVSEQKIVEMLSGALERIRIKLEEV